MDEAMSHVHGPRAKIRALFALVARRLEDADFGASCAVGAVTLDLDADLETVRPATASAFADWRTLIERHIDIPDRKRREAFAGLVLTAIQGGYVRGRAERSVEPFREAARWLGDIAEREAGHA
jgi:hypothetical protein